MVWGETTDFWEIKHKGRGRRKRNVQCSIVNVQCSLRVDYCALNILSLRLVFYRMGDNSGRRLVSPAKGLATCCFFSILLILKTNDNAR